MSTNPGSALAALDFLIGEWVAENKLGAMLI